MTERFEKTGPYAVRSTDGFVVELTEDRGVVYRDASGETTIGHSWLGKPPGISLHPDTLRARSLDELRVELITKRATRALEYLGYYVDLF